MGAWAQLSPAAAAGRARAVQDAEARCRRRRSRKCGRSGSSTRACRRKRSASSRRSRRPRRGRAAGDARHPARAAPPAAARHRRQRRPGTAPPPVGTAAASRCPRRRSGAASSDGRGAPARRSAPLARRFAALGYEGLLLAAIVLLVGFLTLPAGVAGAAPAPALAVPPLPARVLVRLRRLRRGRPLFRLVVDRRPPDAADEDVAPARSCAPTAGRSTPGPRVVRYVAAWIGPRACARSPTWRCSRRAWARTRCGSSPSTTSGRSSIRDRQFLHDRIAGTRIVATATRRASVRACAAPAPRPTLISTMPATRARRASRRT